MNRSREKEFIKLYQNFKDKIYTYFSYRLDFNKPLAEDLTQDTFLKAFKAFESFDCEKPFAPWIYQIAHNLLVNHYRDKKTELDLSSIKEPAVISHKIIEVRCDAENAMKKIKKLKGNLQEIVVLRYVNELSNKEIAVILNKDEGAIRTSLCRALKTLGRLFK